MLAESLDRQWVQRIGELAQRVREDTGARPTTGCQSGSVDAPVTLPTDERRALPIDPRTIAPALLVFALAVVMSVVLPNLDSRATYRHQIHAGDVVEVAGGITLVPAPGWDLANGALVGKTRSAIGPTASSELVHGSVTFFLQVAPFVGTPSALLTRIDKLNDDLHRSRGRDAGTTDRYEVKTAQGAVGVAENFVGVARQGSVVAFVLTSHGQAGLTREGVEIVAAGPMEEITRLRDDIVGMISSLRTAS